MKKILSGIRWFFGICFILAALTSGGLLAKVAGVLFGASLLPITWKIIREKTDKVKKVHSVILAFVLFLAWGAFLPAAEQTEGREDAHVESSVDAFGEKESNEGVSDEELSSEQSVVGKDKNEATEDPFETEVETIPDTDLTVQEPVTASGTAASENYDMTVHFLDVDQGLAILVQSGEEVLVYDGGDRDTSSYVVSYLKNQGVTTIDYLISSHYDSDHVYGLIGCLNAFDVENVISSDYVHDSQTYTKFITAVAEEGLEMQHPSVGSEFSFGTGRFTILAPETVDAGETNDNSVVIKLHNGNHSFIFTGDAEHGSEASMVSSGLDLECNVLCVGHHGSATGTSWDFLQAAVPEYAVISCGVDNQYGHPDADVMEKLESMEIEIFRTDKQGTIIAASDGNTLTWNVEPSQDYSSGEDGISDAAMSENNGGAGTSSATNAATAPSGESDDTADTEPEVQEPENDVMVWVSATGEKYHTINNCGRMNPNKARQMSKSDAESRGLDACSKCY